MILFSEITILFLFTGKKKLEKVTKEDTENIKLALWACPVNAIGFLERNGRLKSMAEKLKKYLR